MKLWMSKRPTQWFLVPDDADWPDGTTSVQDMGGAEALADLDALLTFKVSSTAAMEHAKAKTLALQAKLDARNAAEQARQEARRNKSPNEQIRDLLAPLAERFSDREKAATFLDSFGLDLQRLEHADPESVQHMAKDILGPLLTALDQPDGRLQALDQMQAALRDHGMDKAADRLANAPEEVGKMLDEWNLR